MLISSTFIDLKILHCGVFEIGRGVVTVFAKRLDWAKTRRDEAVVRVITRCMCNPVHVHAVDDCAAYASTVVAIGAQVHNASRVTLQYRHVRDPDPVDRHLNTVIVNMQVERLPPLNFDP